MLWVKRLRAVVSFHSARLFHDDQLRVNRRFLPVTINMDSATQLERGSCLYVKESQSLPLKDFAGYYSHRLPQCALIDAIGIKDDHSVSNEALSQGELLLTPASVLPKSMRAAIVGERNHIRLVYDTIGTHLAVLYRL